MDPILTKIETEARAEAAALDISTLQGRKAIASLAHKIARSKTALDAAGKTLVSGWKEQSKKVDIERARGWDFLENLQADIRRPLTDWENAEKERVAKHEANLEKIVGAGIFTLGNWQTIPVEAMRERLAEVEADAKLDWQEFAARAEKAAHDAASDILKAIEKRKTYDAQQAELERLRREQAEREQRERDERIAAEAAEKAKVEAEEKARKDAEAEAAKVKAQRDLAEQERQRTERERKEAEDRAMKAEADRRAAVAEAEAQAKKAEADRIAALEKAERDRKEAAEAAEKAERERIAAEQKKSADELAAREADVKHRAKINRYAMDAINEIIEAFAETGNNPSKAIIEAIARGKIPNVKISY